VSVWELELAIINLLYVQVAKSPLYPSMSPQFTPR
jgi:hypothetical protein